MSIKKRPSPETGKGLKGGSRKGFFRKPKNTTVLKSGQMRENSVSRCRLNEAGTEAFFKQLFIQVFTDKYEAVQGFITGFPLPAEITLNNAENGLKHEIAGFAGQTEDALHPVEGAAVQHLEHAEPCVEPLEIHLAGNRQAERRNALAVHCGSVLMVVMCFVLVLMGVVGFGIILEGSFDAVQPVGMENGNAEKPVDGHLSLCTRQHGGFGVDFADEFDGFGLLRLAGKIGFVEQDEVRTEQLLTGFGGFGELPAQVQGIGNGDDAVEPEIALNVDAAEKRLRDRHRIGHAGGFNHDAVEFLPPRFEGFQHPD